MLSKLSIIVSLAGVAARRNCSSRRSAAGCRRKAGCGSGAWLRLDSGLLPVGWPGVCVGAWHLGVGPAARSGMGATSLGPPARRVGVGGGALVIAAF